MRATLTLLASLAFIALLPGVSNSQAQREIQPDLNGPVRHLYPVQHTVRVLRANAGMSIQLVGTSLMPKAHGDVKISIENDRVNIQFTLENMDPAKRLGSDYLTFVGWALTKDGAQNLGEFVLDGDKSKAAFSTRLESFALIITAEPDFAVKNPGDMVVLEGDTRTNAMGDRLAANLAAQDDTQTPLILKEARNAVQLARFAGAERKAARAFRMASQSLEQAETLFREQPPKPQAVESTARAAVIAAEEARAAVETNPSERRLAQAP